MTPWGGAMPVVSKAGQMVSQWDNDTASGRSQDGGLEILVVLMSPTSAFRGRSADWYELGALAEAFRASTVGKAPMASVSRSCREGT
jgi:hypothetical protein